MVSRSALPKGVHFGTKRAPNPLFRAPLALHWNRYPLPLKGSLGPPLQRVLSNPLACNPLIPRVPNGNVDSWLTARYLSHIGTQKGLQQDPTSGPSSLPMVGTWGPDSPSVLGPSSGPCLGTTLGQYRKYWFLGPCFGPPFGRPDPRGLGIRGLPLSVINCRKWPQMTPKWALNAQFWSPRGTTPTGCWTP